MASSKFDVFELAKNFEAEEDQFTFLLGIVEDVNKYVDESRKKVAKAVVTEFLAKFSDDKCKYREDARILRAWDIFARTSLSLGFDAVFQKLMGLGYFKHVLEFYRLWADHYVQSKDRAGFENVRRLACQEINPRDVNMLFNNLSKDLGVKYNDDGDTVNFLDKIGGNTPLRAPLAVVNEESEHNLKTMSSGSSGSTSSNDLSCKRIDENTLPKNLSKQSSSSHCISPLGVSKESTSIPKAAVSKAPAGNYSFTDALYRNACNAFGETLPLSQELPEQLALGTFQPVISSNDKDFSVFTDEPSIFTKNPSTPVASVRISDAYVRDSPATKRARNRCDSDEEIECDNPFGDVAVFNKPGAPAKVYDFDKDDVTVAALNKQTTSRASSTPTGGRSTIPTFEVSPTATFPISKSQDDLPFTFAPSVGKAAEISSPRPKALPPLSEAISRMSIAPCDLDDTTHDISVMPEVQIKSGINPWSDSERQKVLQKAPPMVEQHEFLTTKCPGFAVGQTVNLGGEKFKVLDFIAQGGFARVFKAKGEDAKDYAIKLEMPSCPWEVYVCKSLSCRLPTEIQPFVMSIRDAFIFSNASALIYEFHPMQSLLNLANAYKESNSHMDGMLVAFVGIQIAEILKYVHEAKIIHADIKPDNLVIVQQLTGDLPSTQYSKPFVKLIDWGRAIDMCYYPDTTFKGRAGTNGFDCTEMQEGRPWTFQTDYYGFVGTIHVLMFNEYMRTFFNEGKKAYVFVEVLKRRYPLYDCWSQIFRAFLNIESCEKCPGWGEIVQRLKQDLDDFAGEDISSWKRGVDKCNTCLRNAVLKIKN